jgi:hypothetical protein
MPQKFTIMLMLVVMVLLVLFGGDLRGRRAGQAQT